MTSSGCKHFVEGELSMQVPLDDIDPFRISWVTVQFLKTHLARHFVAFSKILSTTLKPFHTSAAG